MRAMGKPVLYLVEKTCHYKLADGEGFLHHKFVWAAPQQDIPGHVKAWLVGLPRQGAWRAQQGAG